MSLACISRPPLPRCPPASLMAAAHLCQTLLCFFAVAGLPALHHVAQIGVFAHLIRRPNARIVPVLQERQHICHRGLRARRGGAPDGFTQHCQRHLQHIRRGGEPLHLRRGGNRTEIRPPNGGNLLIARAPARTRAFRFGVFLILFFWVTRFPCLVFSFRIVWYYVTVLKVLLSTAYFSILHGKLWRGSIHENRHGFARCSRRVCGREVVTFCCDRK